MNLTLITTNNCSTCKRVEVQLLQFAALHKEINLVIADINEFKRRGVAIVPALLIEDELFAYGDIDEEKLLSRLK